MKARSYEKVIKRFYRTDLHRCPECQRTLKRALTITERKVITLDGVIQVTHGGYRCKNAKCKAKGRTYRSPAADALALPRFTFGLDGVALRKLSPGAEYRALEAFQFRMHHSSKISGSAGTDLPNGNGTEPIFGL